MLHINNFENQMISGASTEELEFLCQLSPFIDDDDPWNQWTGLRQSDVTYLENVLTDADVDLDVNIPDLTDLDETTTQTLDNIE